eukprot:CAMPEP_0206448760 /NCGR_PEP_ID=MMETSP0324_2-20121206/17679_1 /ASSEMBLY_ACC=CAM_ASM_000836 /TAXON_ID=2866 /ORGANISM="Crypthecodinium cohnii, Strain Seligo" /LENGTH=175 /DNA_ID=CAMNT_0053917995 /DNA_START=653 /DNA_END=1180 /DNA_ORIENTATION=+
MPVSRLHVSTAVFAHIVEALELVVVMPRDVVKSVADSVGSGFFQQKNEEQREARERRRAGEQRGKPLGSHRTGKLDLAVVVGADVVVVVVVVVAVVGVVSVKGNHLSFPLATCKNRNCAVSGMGMARERSKRPWGAGRSEENKWQVASGKSCQGASRQVQRIEGRLEQPASNRME